MQLSFCVDSDGDVIFLSGSCVRNIKKTRDKWTIYHNNESLPCPHAVWVVLTKHVKSPSALLAVQLWLSKSCQKKMYIWVSLCLGFKIQATRLSNAPKRSLFTNTTTNTTTTKLSTIWQFSTINFHNWAFQAPSSCHKCHVFFLFVTGLAVTILASAGQQFAKVK